MARRLPKKITPAMMRRGLKAAAVSDALDALGFRAQSPRVVLVSMTRPGVLVGRCRTTLWAEQFHRDPRPYELELRAVDGCRPGDVMIAAAGGSTRSGVWGELLSTAAMRRGCIGAVVDGCVRDVAQMTRMGFAVFARGTCVTDSRDRQRVIDLDVDVEIGGVVVRRGDLVVADGDGLVVVPRAVEEEAVRAAWAKLHAENEVRDAIRRGMSATEAFEKFGVL